MKDLVKYEERQFGNRFIGVITDDGKNLTPDFKNWLFSILPSFAKKTVMASFQISREQNVKAIEYRSRQVQIITRKPTF